MSDPKKVLESAGIPLGGWTTLEGRTLRPLVGDSRIQSLLRIRDGLIEQLGENQKAVEALQQRLARLRKGGS